MLGATGRYLDFTDRVPLAKTAELSEASLAVDLEAKQLCTGLTEEELTWRPRPGKWSVVENLSHLRATTEVFLPVVDCALEASRTMGLRSEGPFALSPLGRLIVWRMDARPVIKMRAPKPLQPRLLSSAGSELDHFLSSQAALRERIEEANGLDLTAWRFTSPVASYFRVNLLEFFSAFNAHSRRHICQASNVRRALLTDARRP
ncbi:DinB family protein [Acidisarcina polymorpha]|uniref:DinB family protein n=1 Tax=Acidisarcina polymorpha TaxID=2211140 RepID=UPI000DEF7FDE|nr:DinB family protein [Acidisarcina polymorpha]